MRRTRFRALAGAGALLLGAAPALAPAAPAGAASSRTTTFVTNVKLSGCNLLEYGFQVDGKMGRLGTNRRSQCEDVFLRDKRFGFPEGSSVLFYLRDVSCDAIYFSDGSGDADHATTSGGNPLTVDIADAGGACEVKNTNVTPTVGNGNLSLVAEFVT
jgi:hypothetical protein